ncbi:MAG: Mur ligase family protein, partial [Pyrinomonadaceae bacterium]
VLQALADDGVTHAAMEASSHGFDQSRLDGVKLAAGAFTNLTQDHLDYHHTMDAYREAKMRLWSLLKPGQPAIVNADAADGPAFEAGAKAKKLNVVSCGWRAGADGLKIVEIQPRPNGPHDSSFAFFMPHFAIVSRVHSFAFFIPGEFVSRGPMTSVM